MSKGEVAIFGKLSRNHLASDRTTQGSNYGICLCSVCQNTQGPQNSPLILRWSGSSYFDHSSSSLQIGPLFQDNQQLSKTSCLLLSDHDAHESNLSYSSRCSQAARCHRLWYNVLRRRLGSDCTSKKITLRLIP